MRDQIHCIYFKMRLKHGRMWRNFAHALIFTSVMMRWPVKIKQSVTSFCTAVLNNVYSSSNSKGCRHSLTAFCRMYLGIFVVTDRMSGDIQQLSFEKNPLTAVWRENIKPWNHAIPICNSTFFLEQCATTTTFCRTETHKPNSFQETDTYGSLKNIIKHQ